MRNEGDRSPSLYLRAHRQPSQKMQNKPPAAGGTPTAGWNQRTYQDVRDYNSETNTSRDYWPRVMCLCWFVDDHRNDNDWKEFALSNSAHAKLRQARADFKASDTSTGIVKVESSLGPATAELAAGVTRLAPFIG